MRVGIYTPYLDTAGGGEKYMLTIAESLASENHVDLLLDDHLSKLDLPNILKKISLLHELNLEKVNLVKAPLGKGSNFLERSFFLKKYDLLIYLSDGSIFYSTAKKNILHFQSPIKKQGKGLWFNFKLSSWNQAIFNSKFTRDEFNKSWKIRGKVIYPPVYTDKIKPSLKKNQIISVGRFFSYLKDKKHGILIDAFKKMYDMDEVKGWSLHLVGGAGDGDMGYVEDLKKQAKDYPIKIYPNLEFKELIKLYGESKIYWHGAGYSETDPTKMEHFGITTVEGMSAGCVPIVINLGGQKEIVEDGKSGYLWNSLDELMELTLKVIKNEKLTEKLSERAKDRAKIFSKENFSKNIKQFI